MENDLLLEKAEEFLNGTFHTINQPLYETDELSLEDRNRMLRYTEKISLLTLKNYYLREDSRSTDSPVSSSSTWPSAGSS